MYTTIRYLLHYEANSWYSQHFTGDKLRKEVRNSIKNHLRDLRKTNLILINYTQRSWTAFAGSKTISGYSGTWGNAYNNGFVCAAMLLGIPIVDSSTMSIHSFSLPLPGSSNIPDKPLPVSGWDYVNPKQFCEIAESYGAKVYNKPL